MSNRPSYPDDEPVIGLSEYNEEPVDDGYVEYDGASTLPGRVHRTEVIEPYYEDDLDPYYDRYLQDSPARNPWFYAFLVAAAVVGAVVVFAIVRSIESDEDGEPAATSTPMQILQVGLISPREGDRVIAGEEMTFAANVAASEEITKVELLIDDKPYAEGSATLKPSTVGATSTPAAAQLYEAVVKARFTDRGDHKAALRITSGGETRDSEAITFLVVEPPGDPRVEGRVIATTAVRSGPSDDFPEVDRLQPGAAVLLAAKTRDNEWLLLDTDAPGERWIRRNAVQESSSLANLPVRDTSGTPAPTATPTPDGEPTEEPPAGDPDFAPVDARFIFAEGGRAVLRVSVQNAGGDFSGPLVVEAAMSDGRLVSSQLVFDLSLRSGRAATVDFDIAGALPERADVTVSIDPGNAVAESNEDNNRVTFGGVAAPADPPEIIISAATVDGFDVAVRVRNLGGPLGQSEITVRLEIAGQVITQSVVQALDTDEAIDFVLEAPGTGSGTVQVLIDGATADSRPVEVGGQQATPAPTETPVGTATPTPE
jgi:hypothetical protein